MNYQRILCLGDSQTFGARTYGCYPLELARVLTSRSQYQWQAINYSHNGDTARSLWFRLSDVLAVTKDVYQACVLIGANDVGEGKPIELFGEYYRQILRALRIHGIKSIFCGEIPPIHADGHAFFSRAATEDRAAFNKTIAACVAEAAGARVVPLATLPRDCYVDPVHFNERGNQLVARAFAHAVLSQ